MEDLQIKRVSEYEEKFKEGKKILALQDIFDGVKIEVTKILDPRFQVMHTVKMGGHYELGPQKQRAKEKARLQGGTKDQYLYEFTATLMYDNKLFIGRIDTQDRMMGRFQHNVNKWFNYRLLGQTIEEHTAAIIESTIKPSIDSVITVKAINWTQFQAAYMQMMSPGLSLGCELMYNSKTQWANNEFALRYVADSELWIPMDGFPLQYQDGRSQTIATELYLMTINTAKGKKVITPTSPDERFALAKTVFRNIGGFSMGYLKKINTRCTMASTLKVGKISQDKWDTSLKIGLEYLLPMLISFKAQFNTNGTITSLFDDMASGQFRMQLSSKINYFKSIYRFGLGFSLYS